MKRESGLIQINSLLQELNTEGGFEMSVLTDSQGLTIASSSKAGMNPERQSAVVAFMQKAALQACKQLGLSETDEVSFSDSGGHHVVCRFFNVHDHGLILAVMAASRDHSYRRATNHAVHRIEKIWSQFWE